MNSRQVRRWRIRAGWRVRLAPLLLVVAAACHSKSEIHEAASPVLVRIEIAPSARSIPAGHVASFVATGVYSDGSVSDISPDVTWLSSRPSVVSLQEAGPTPGCARAMSPGVANVVATQGGTAGYALVGVSNAGMARLPALHSDAREPRYFVDPQGNAVYLTGSHTWSSLQDNGQSDPPPAFGFNGYLDALDAYGHNFFRLYSWEQAKWTADIGGDYWIAPMPFERTGPGRALDGKPRFDLTKFNQEYFDRLRQRVAEADRRGIYVSVMLFNGWSVHPQREGMGNPWRGHPFNRENNINRIDGDPNHDDSGRETHTLLLPAVTALQEAYVRKVVDTVNGFANVLFEISNESSVGSADWQNHMIAFIRQHEAGLRNQHPVGMTVEWPDGSNQTLASSAADWISPRRSGRDPLEPMVFAGSKVIINDTDHLCGVCGNYAWVWKSLLRELNPIVMDPYDGKAVGLGASDDRIDKTVLQLLRKNMGYARVFAERVDLKAMRPDTGLASGVYGLARASTGHSTHLIFMPDAMETRVDLRAASGPLAVKWFNPTTGQLLSAPSVRGGARLSFSSPFGKGAVLYVSAAHARSNASPRSSSDSRCDPH